MMRSTTSSNKYNVIVTEDLNLAALKTNARNTYDALKSLTKKALLLVKSTINMVKIPQLVDTILSFVRSIPIVNVLVPNPSNEEARVKEMVSVTEIGDIVTTLANITQFLFTTIWKLLPASNAFKKNIIMPIFNYNDRLTFMRSLYKMIVDSSVPPKYAKAYIIIMTLRIPIYNILFVFKSFWSKEKSDPTMDDKTHPWTSGNPVYDKETGMNETERRIHKKIQLFIQIHKTATTDVESSYRLTKTIIKDSIMGIVVPFLLPMFNFFRISFGIGNEEGSMFYMLDGMIKTVLIIYYYYFLITAMILSSLAVDKEESKATAN